MGYSLDDLVDRDRDAPTLAEIHRMMRDREDYRREHEGIWAHPIVAPEPTDRQIYTVTVRVDRTLAGNPTALRTARRDLAARLDHYVATRGFNVMRVREATVPPSGPHDPIELRLEADLQPRTDGEWPSIRAAIAEDEGDRQIARGASHTVNDRLDALASSVAYWGDRELRGLQSPHSAPEATVPCRPSPLPYT